MSTNCNGTVLRVSAEVLSQIFGFALYSDELNTWDNCIKSQIPTTKGTPWPFMRVCRQWHDIASSDPGLWSTFIVNIRQLESPIDDVSRLPTIFEQVLRRSQQNPLTLKLALSATPYLAGIDEDGLSHMINVFTKLAQMAAGHCERWRDVFLCINPGSYFYNSLEDEGTLGLGGLRLLVSRMPMLRSLEVENHVPRTMAWTLGIDMTPHNSLVAFRTRGSIEYSFQTDMSQLEIGGFPKVTILQIKSSRVDRSFDIFWKIAKLCPNVEELDCGASPCGAGSNVNLVPDMELKKLSHLHLLHLGLYNGAIENLSFPSLERLDLHGMDLDDHSFHTELRNFLGRLSSSVVHLRLSFNSYNSRLNTLSESSVEDLLRPMVRLLGLTIGFKSEEMHGIPKALFQALLHTAFSGQSVLQRLEYLRPELNAGAVQFDWTRYRDFIIALYTARRDRQGRFRLQLDVLSGVTLLSLNTRREAESLLRGDADIRACANDSFTIIVNGHEVLQA